MDPATTWWIKGDGVDIVKGLGVSVRGEWAGDADLNNGVLNSHRQKTTAEIGLGEREAMVNVALQELSYDLTFVHSGEYITFC